MLVSVPLLSFLAITYTTYMKQVYILTIIFVLATGLIVGFAVSKNHNEVQSTERKNIIVSGQEIKEVTMSPNKGNKNSTDINALLNTGEVILLATYDDIYRDHYHPFEYIDGDIFVIRRIGDSSAGTDWVDELWKISLSGSEKRLFSQKGLDFRVSPNKQFIVIQDSEVVGQEIVLDYDGVLLKSFPLDQLAIDSSARNSEMYLWSSDSKSFFGGVHFADQDNIFQISTDEWTVQKFNFDGNLHNHDWDLNSDIASIAYSDYPSFADAAEAEEFDASDTDTHLYIVSLLTGEKISVDSAVAKQFHPKWISNTEIQYSNPVSDELKLFSL